MLQEPDEPDGLALMAKPNPRRSNGHRRTELRKWLAAQGRPYHICGKSIDYSLPPGHPMSFEVDEIVPVSKGGNPLDRSNVDAAHRICNQRRGNRPIGAQVRPPTAPISTSREW